MRFCLYRKRKQKEGLLQFLQGTAMLIEQIQDNINLVPGVKDVDVELTFDPPWNPDKMSDDAKAHLGID